MARGGRQPGAGRPKGAKSLIKAIDYFNPQELKAFWDDLKIRAKTDSKIALYFAEQFTGKAVQPIGNHDDEPFKIQGIDIVIRK